MHEPEERTRMLHLLYVDDEEGLREVTKLYLERAGDIRVDTAASAAEALAMMREQAYDAIISDYQMPVMDGVRFLKTVRASGATIPFVLFTGKGREDVVIEAYECGANFYIQKGGEPKSQYAELLHKVRKAVELRGAQLALERSEEFYRRLYNETPLGIVYYDIHGVVLDCNDTFVELVGSSKDRLLGLDILHDLDDASLVRAVTASLASGKGYYRGTYASTTAEKSTYVNIMFKGMRNSHGEIYGGIGLIEDITAHMRAEDQLNSLSEEYETVFMGTQDAMFLVGVGTDGFRYIRSNRSHQERTGFSLETLRGKTPQELVGTELGDTIAANYQRCVDSGGPITYEENLILPTGPKVWRTTLTPVFNQGIARYIVGSSLDITGYRLALAKARESEESYRALVENLIEVLYTLDRNAIVEYVSPNIEALGGYAVSEVLGRCFVEFVHPHDRKGRIEQFSKVLSGDMDATEYRFMTKDGRTIWVRTSARPIIRDGVISGLQGVLVDITTQKMAELALRNSEVKFRTLFEDSRDAIWVTSVEGIILDANTASFELLGYPREAFIGITAETLYANPADRDEFIRRIHEHGYVKDYEILLLRKDGSTVLCTFTSHLWLNDDGDVLGYRGIVRDITAQKRMEDDLRNQARLQELLIDISSTFIGVAPDQVDAIINSSLAKLGSVVGADRAYVIEYHFGRQVMCNTHEWCAEGIEPQIGRLQDVPFSQVGPTWIDTHLRGAVISIIDVSAFPAESPERPMLEQQGIKSLIAVPLMDNERCLGCVGFDSVRGFRSTPYPSSIC